MDLAQNTIESRKECNLVDGLIQRSRLTVNHKCKKFVGESSRRVDGQKRASDRVDGTMQDFLGVYRGCHI